MKYESAAEVDSLIYHARPKIMNAQDDRPADAEPTEADGVESSQTVLKSWVLPTGNDFIGDPAERHTRPPGDPGSDFPFVQSDYDDNG